MPAVGKGKEITKTKIYFDDFPLLSIKKKKELLYYIQTLTIVTLQTQSFFFISSNDDDTFKKINTSSRRPTGGLRLYKDVAGGDVCTPVLLDGD